MLARLVELITGDSASPESRPGPQAVPMLAAYLGYRAYSPDEQLFHLTRSKGFVLELAPLIGADDRISDILGTVFADVLLPGCQFQIINYASPRIAEKLQEWALPRVRAGAVFDKLARYRLDLLTRGAWTSLAGDGPFHVRQFRVLFAVGVAEGGAVSNDQLLSVRDGIVAAFDSINVPSRVLGPTDLIRFIDDMLCPSTGTGDDAPEYSPFDPINEQCVRRDLVTRVEKDRLILEASSLRPSGNMIDGAPDLIEVTPHAFDVRTMSVRYFPERWAPWDTQKVIGDVFNPKLCLPCPVLQSISGIIPATDLSEAKASWKFTRTTTLSDGKAARLVPALKSQSAEWSHVQQQVRLGQKLVQIYYSVTVISPLGRGDFNERTLKAIYKAAGWDLIDETYLQLGGLLASFPLLLADGLSADLMRMRRFRTVLSANVASLAPLQGEYNGSTIPHLLFIGRRGQPQFWSPFQNSAGNHNVAIAGKSGSGKSVLLQDLTASLAGVHARVIVIDDGRSFEHMAKALGGTFTEFRQAAGISLNPFRMIDPALAADDPDYLIDCLAMLKAIISQMARFENRLNDTERGLIDAAVNTVWNEQSRDGTIDAVMEALRGTGHPLAEDLATAMLPFSAAGTFGQFFLGDTNLDLSADLTVFELSDLSSREELRSVVLTSIMFVASQTMRKLDRQIPKALIIDEAWSMLKGGAMADFVETYSRTCRKYGASLVTATQSINDFYKSGGSKAALENSDWMLVLQQKPETIADFRKSDRFEMDNYTDALLRSLKRHGTDYSDLLIRGPDTQCVCRLVLDPFAATLYSSSPATFAKIEAEIAEGRTMAEAIEVVAYPDRVPVHAEARP
ncbi:type IV secretion system protein TraC [Novosphingobium sp. Fuku2-ISO-50]|uniref:type IV secretion system protein TraC n=1 Tax=Novosphingobium sp. Fuku2-ISO-50 TaxID=1739114 RepID=UPI00076D25F0|nr:type IV secretion system protein TraC [Novosphingobium sp. Fuku2-ISO-50]KUR75344.1 (4Fe-4S)-binding protein [Novosphingobium sp. Fuku2-ISO-50]